MTGDAQQIVQDALLALKARIIANMDAYGATASGGTAKHLKVDTDNDGGKLVSVGRMPFGVLETGRKRGKVPYDLQHTIIQWAKDKGIQIAPIPYKSNRPHKYSPAQRGELAFGNAVKWCIARGSRQYPLGGTRLHRSGGRDVIYSREIPKTIDDVKKRLLFHVVKDAKTIKLNTK